MDKIPSIGETRGIFEIFVPGVFLLLNLVAFIYLLPVTYDDKSKQLGELLMNPAAGFLAAVSVGYLLGVALRMLRSEFADRCSACFLLMLWCGDKKKENRHAYEHFPYTLCLGAACKKNFPQAMPFYEKYWRNHASQQFVNFYKGIISVKDQRAGVEIYNAEALSRYISSIFYALLVSSLLLITLVIASRLVNREWLIGVIIAIIVYCFGILVILYNYRLIRLKEMETVFSMCFKNKMVFEDKIIDIPPNVRKHDI